MSLRFAPARTPARSPIARALARRTVAPAANDNADPGVGDDPILVAALRHFAMHGLGAATIAARNASEAGDLGNTVDRDHWQAVSSALGNRSPLCAHRRLRNFSKVSSTLTER